MSVVAHSHISTSINSFETGTELATRIRAGFGSEVPKVVMAYATVHHDQSAILNGMREILGPDVRVVGCSSQGLIGRGMMDERGYIAGAIGLGGSSLNASSAVVEDFHLESAAKGRALGRALKEGSKDPLKLVLLHYDPLCGADLDGFLRGLHETVGCPVVGGAAAEFWGPWKQTFQYSDQRVLSKAAVAVGLSGDCTIETDLCHGTATIGVEMTVTKAEGNTMLELDGRPALDVWQEICAAAPAHIPESGALGVGLPTKDPNVQRVLCVVEADEKRCGVTFQAGLPTGTRVTFHQRTVEGVVGGTQQMALSLADRLKGKKMRAVIGYECGARTSPFLGQDATLRENVALQATLSADAAWLGTIVWGEIYMFDGQPALANFSYPLVVIAE